MVWILVGIRGCVPRPTGHSLVTLFFLSMSVKDQPLHWVLGKSQTYYPEHILVYGHRKAHCSLVMGSSFSGLTNWRRGWWRSKHHNKSRTQEWGLGVQVWTGTWTP